MTEGSEENEIFCGFGGDNRFHLGNLFLYWVFFGK